MELLRDRSEELQDAGVRPFGISRDSPWTHVAWMQALDLTVPLLSDWNGEAVRAFGLARSYRGMEDVPVRSAFLVDQAGTVRRSWRYDDAEVPDLDAIVAAARAL
jgi:glutaredoxin-dependent peroxiredoxin